MTNKTYETVKRIAKSALTTGLVALALTGCGKRDSLPLSYTCKGTYENYSVIIDVMGENKSMLIVSKDRTRGHSPAELYARDAFPESFGFEESRVLPGHNSLTGVDTTGMGKLESLNDPYKLANIFYKINSQGDKSIR